MAVKLICNSMEDYLKSGKYIDWGNPVILRLADCLFAENLDELGYEKSAYHYVRDDIKHSWDAQDRRATAKASQVVREKVGICWDKANLLAALLRAKGISTGICYQRLTRGKTPDTGYCIHALNAVYLKPVGRWIRIDARGNTGDVNAEFDIAKKRLAFSVRPECGETEYPEIHAELAPVTMRVLEESDDALYMYRYSLPETL